MLHPQKCSSSPLRVLFPPRPPFLTTEIKSPFYTFSRPRTNEGGKFERGEGEGDVFFFWRISFQSYFPILLVSIRLSLSLSRLVSRVTRLLALPFIFYVSIEFRIAAIWSHFSSHWLRVRFLKDREREKERKTSINSPRLGRKRKGGGGAATAELTIFLPSSSSHSPLVKKYDANIDTALFCYVLFRCCGGERLGNLPSC